MRLTRMSSQVIVAMTVLTGLLFVGCNTGNPLATLARSALTDVSARFEQDNRSAQYVRSLKILERHPDFTETVATARAAEELREESDPRCTELFATAALDCWPHLKPYATDDDVFANAVSDVYHRCVAQFVENGSLHQQFDAGHKVSMVTPDGSNAVVPITLHGFTWTADDFNEIRLAETARRSEVRRYWSTPGLGVPLIGMRRRESHDAFLNSQTVFSATCVLRPADEFATRSPAGLNAVLEIHDPIRVKQVTYQQKQWNIARDLSAPLAIANREIDRNKLSSFLDPGSSETESRLRIIEPYRPGKIPIVFIHGLLSDRFTWLDLVNDLRSVEGLNDHYQLWSFQYPTGQPFVYSAAELRASLNQIVKHLDPEGKDPALSQMVLVGHSMGGLVAKSQVTHSDTQIWDSVANRGLDEIKASPEVLRDMQRIFLFEPSPYVKRVVFIGSPHRGSRMAKGIVGKVGSALVHTSEEREARFQAFVRDNPDVLTGRTAERFPSSIELLRPDNPMLLATYDLRVNPAVRLHTIIGTGDDLAGGVPADGVVAVESAKHPGTVSEFLVDATHTELTNHTETTEEVVRILGEHLHELTPVERVASETPPTVR